MTLPILAIWLDHVPVSTILGLIWLFIIAPAAILQFRDWYNIKNRPDNPFDLWSKDRWEITGLKDYPRLFSGLIDFLPKGAIMRFEGVPSGELVGFFEEHSTPELFQIPKGTIWPKMEIYNVPGTKENLQELAELAKGFAPPEVATHFHVYTEKGVLIDWYDAFDDPMCISNQFSEEDIKAFCDRASATYKMQPGITVT